MIEHCYNMEPQDCVCANTASGQVGIALRIIDTASRQRHFETARDAQLAAKAVQNMLDARNALGQSPLMLACRHGYPPPPHIPLAPHMQG